MVCICCNQRLYEFHLLFIVHEMVDSSCTPFALSCCLLGEDQDFAILKKALFIEHCHLFLFCCLCPLLCHQFFHFDEFNLSPPRSFQHLQICDHSQTLSYQRYCIFHSIPHSFVDSRHHFALEHHL